MSDDLYHPRHDLQLLLDDRLPTERRGDAEAHLAVCPQCRSETEALQRLRSALREDLVRHTVPAELPERIRAALRTDAAIAEGAETGRFDFPRRAFIVGGAALAAAAVLALVFVRRRDLDPVSVAAGDFRRFRSDALELELRTDDPLALERFFVARGLGFPTRVFDFGMRGFRLVGGSVHRVGDSPSALVAYRGTDGSRLLCQMYQGTISNLPRPQGIRVVDQIRFQVYRRPSVTLVFWQEGPGVCVLASDGDPDVTVELALAQAVGA
jgi:hypothetical protein